MGCHYDRLDGYLACIVRSVYEIQVMNLVAMARRVCLKDLVGNCEI